MATLALYRTLVPDHAAVDDALITAFLTLAAGEHTASMWGAVYTQAMVWYAAHMVQRVPGVTGIGTGGGGAGDSPGILQSRSAGDLAESYMSMASAAQGGSGGVGDEELRSTRYGMLYLRLRTSRHTRAPTVVQIGGV